MAPITRDTGPNTGTIGAQNKSGPDGAGNTVWSGPDPYEGGAMGQPTHPETYLYRAYADDGRLIYAGITKDVRRRINEHRKRSFWYARTCRFAVTTYPTRQTALAAEARCHTETPPQFGWCEPGQTGLAPPVTPLAEFEVLPREVGF